MGLKKFSADHVNAVRHPENLSDSQVSRTRWALAVVAIVLVASAIIIAIIVNQPAEKPTVTASPTAGPVITYSDPSASTSTPCLDNTNRDITTKAPKVEQWTVAGWAPIPSVKGAGPCGKAVGGVDTGFAKTETGALVAAITWGAQLQEGLPNAGTVDALKAVVVEGPDRDAIIERVKRIRSGAEAPAEDPTGKVQIVGYRIRLNGNTAQIDFQLSLNTAGGSSSGVIPVRLEWIADDWKMVPASSTDLARAVPLSDPSGFVPFAPGIQS